MNSDLPHPLHTPLCSILKCRVPILLAGMGGVARWQLAAAVAKAGGYPTLGMVRETPALIASEIRAFRAATNRSFAVNLIPAATEPALLEAQLRQCLELDVMAFSFFWDVMPEVVARVRETGATVLHQVGSLEQALRAQDAGVDVIIAQGIEAGGHVHGRNRSFDLAKEIIQETQLPVVIAGGISTGKELADALGLGAQGVQCGTAFLATDESFAHQYHKQRVVDADAEDTVLTDVFVLNWPKGAAVRVIGNSITKALNGNLFGHDPDTLPREAIAWDDDVARYRFSTDSPLRTTTGDLEAMPSFGGHSVGSIRDIVPAKVRLEKIEHDAVLCMNSERAAEKAPFSKTEVPQWRKLKRTELRALRKTLSVDAHATASNRIALRLEAFLNDRFDGAGGRVLSMYWPIKGEPDLRDLMSRLHAGGVIIALPLVETKAAPLVFRRWTPLTKMTRGDWNIPVPPPEAEILKPEIALAPLVGWDMSGYRLGYGGGYFDRTLAALDPSPFKIGIGYASARLETIFPQPHDIPMDIILTEAGTFAD